MTTPPRQPKRQRIVFLYKRDHQVDVVSNKEAEQGRIRTRMTTATIPSNVTHVKLDDDVSEIANRSFEQRVNLVEVELSSPCLERIGESAFEDCMSLRRVGFSLPSSSPSLVLLTSIGKNAFLLCESLRDLPLPAGLLTIEEGAFASCSSLEHVSIPSSVSSIGDCVFASCTSLRNLTFQKNDEDDDEEGLMQIGDRAFSCCSSLTTVKIPSTVRTIGKSAFELCHMLVQVNLLHSTMMEYIGEFTFAWCRGLTTIWLPTTLKRIGRGAFKGCTALRKIDLLQTQLETIGSEAFYDSGLRTLTVPRTVTNIGTCACQHCYMLGEVELQEGLKEISNWAFANCRSLRAIFLPSSLIRIGDGAFRDCFNMLGVEVTKNARVKFGQYVFQRCKGIYSISFQGTITDFPATTFAGCPQLKDDGCWMDATKIIPTNHAVYFSRGVTMQDFCRLIAQRCPLHITSIDITPFHMLIATPELRHDIFRALLRRYPLSWLSAGIIGAGNHTTMMDYLLNNVTPKVISFLQMVIQATIMERIRDGWGLARQQIAPMQRLVEELDLNLNNHNQNHNHNNNNTTRAGAAYYYYDNLAALRSSIFRLFQEMKRYEEEESLTILELALWKAKKAASGDIAIIMTMIEQADQRLISGSHVVIPSVLQYLWNVGSPRPPSIAFSATAQPEH
ncbi:unnamed protein product [Cylindrotheca closterium]|uniref:Uncharacterized protein n=1 Tax=Cylindrotheca closterium TaxID=2856 RepID=A0AAD2FQZ0_9STRA|nr:unnamed protein product [Cylindrotheca closterium]